MSDTNESPLPTPTSFPTIDQILPDAAIGPAVPVLSVAFRAAELLKRLSEAKPTRRYFLTTNKERPLGNIIVRIVEGEVEKTVHLPAYTRNGQWLMTPWQFLEWELQNLVGR